MRLAPPGDRGSRGECNPGARLSEADVREVRRLYKHGFSKHELAARYGMSPYSIYEIVFRRTWAHLDEEE